MAGETAEDAAVGFNPVTGSLFGFFVRGADTLEVGLPVVLSVQGNTIVGQLISGREYFDQVGSEFAETAKEGTDESEGWREIFGELADEFPAREESTKRIEAGNPPLEHTPEYFHLKDARIVDQPGALPPTENDGFLWRGRLESVDGFAIWGM